MAVCVAGIPQEASGSPKSYPQTGADSTSQRFRFRLTVDEVAHLKSRFGNQAFLMFLSRLKPESVIADIGSGDGFYADLFERHGHKVYRIDAKYGRFYETTPWRPYNAIWCCHTLEHMRNPGAALDKMFSECEHAGLVAITVPPLKHGLVGGHVSLWNVGLLLYHMVLSGFDCRGAYIGSYGYNLSVMVEKKPCKVAGLIYDKGDLEKVSQFFPQPMVQGQDGRIGDIRWGMD